MEKQRFKVTARIKAYRSVEVEAEDKFEAVNVAADELEELGHTVIGGVHVEPAENCSD